MQNPFPNIANHLPEIIFAVDSKGCIVYSNFTFESIVAPFERVQNLSFADEFISGSSYVAFSQAMHEALRTGNNYIPVSKCQTLCFGYNDIPLYRNIDWVVSGSMKDGNILVSGRIVETPEVEGTQAHVVENELVDFFQNAPIALHWLNGKGVIMWANKAELDMLGYTADEYIGHSMDEFCPEDIHLLNRIINQLHDGKSIANETIRFQTKDGATRYLLFDANANFDTVEIEDIRHEDEASVISEITCTTINRLRHIRCFLRDDTDRLIMGAINSHESERIEKNSTEKLKFLRSIIHEISVDLDDLKVEVGLLKPAVGAGSEKDCFRESLDEMRNSICSNSSGILPMMSSHITHSTSPVSNVNTVTNATNVLTITDVDDTSSTHEKLELAPSSVEYVEKFVMNTRSLVEKINFAMLFENNSVMVLQPERTSLLGTINTVIRNTRSIWGRKEQESLQVIVNTCQEDNSFGGIPEEISVDSGLFCSLHYILNVATAFAPDNAVISLDINYSEIMPPTAFNVHSRSKDRDDYNDYFTIELGGGGGGGGGIIGGGPLANGGTSRNSLSNNFYNASNSNAKKKSGLFTFLIRHTCVVPMDPLTIYNSFKNYACEGDIYRDVPATVLDCSNTDQLMKNLASNDLKLGLFVASNMISLMDGSLKFSVVPAETKFWFSIPIAFVLPGASGNSSPHMMPHPGGGHPTATSLQSSRHSSISQVENVLGSKRWTNLQDSTIASNLYKKESTSNPNTNSNKLFNMPSPSGSLKANPTSNPTSPPIPPINTTTAANTVDAVHVNATVNKSPSNGALVNATSQRRPMRILVVDDSVICQRVLAQALNKIGYLTDVADNGRAALDKLVHIPCLFDAVIMDVIMPIMDGYNALKVCRQDLHLNLPIFVLSADVLPDTRQSMLSIGASAFVAKPIKLLQMIELLHKFDIKTQGSIAFLEERAGNISSNTTKA